MLTVEQKNEILITLSMIADLLIDNNIDVRTFDYTDYRDIYNVIVSFDDCIEVHAGMSKLALYIPFITKEYCIKMPFCFNCMDDVCAYEMDLYDGIENTYKEVFMKEECIGYIYDILPIYIQPYVETLAVDMEEWNGTVTLPDIISAKQEIEAKYYIENSGSDSYLWNYNILRYYGYQMGKKILEIVHEFSDLHDENVGYLANGQPVVFDYGGI